jgi:hypothetical protein
MIIKREKLKNGQFRDTILLNPNRHFGSFFLEGIVKGKDGFMKNRWIMDASATLTPATSTEPAYYGSTSSGGFANPDKATTEFTSAMYADVQTYGDGSYATTSVTSASRAIASVAHLFTFNTAGYAGISDIQLVWGGYFTVSSPGVIEVNDLEAYQGSTSTWIGWISITTSDTEYTLDIGTGSAYFYNSTWLRFGVVIEGYNSKGTTTVTLYSDYAAIIITYSVAVPYVPAMSGDGLSWIVSVAKKHVPKLASQPGGQLVS